MDIEDLPDGPLGLFDQWLGDTEESGCIFARLLTRKRRFDGREIIVATGPNAIDQIAEAAKIAEADRDISRLTILLPDVETEVDLGVICASLAKHSGWYTVRVNRTTHDPNHRLIGLRREMTQQAFAKPVDIEWLAFGPFDAFAPTRQAPIAVLEGFVDPYAVIDSPGATRLRAHLALIEAPLRPKAFDAMEKATQQLRRKRIGRAEDHRAKARVTLTIGASDAQRIGL